MGAVWAQRGERATIMVSVVNVCEVTEGKTVKDSPLLFIYYFLYISFALL